LIPKVIHQIWVGPPLPDHLAAIAQTWQQHHPDWTVTLWTEETLPRLRNQRIFDEADVLAPRHAGQLRSDIARYELLLDHGGVYVDVDLECLRPIDALTNVECFAGWERANQWVGNTILGAAPGHPFMRALVAGVDANVRRRIGARPNVLTGPRYLTGVYRRHAKQVTVYGRDLFYAAGYDDLDARPEDHPDAYAFHWWGNQRCKHGQPGWAYAR
jgi:inositol phosphorylceramide mannosyltransferase catalytic subunit